METMLMQSFCLLCLIFSFKKHSFVINVEALDTNGVQHPTGTPNFARTPVTGREVPPANPLTPVMNSKIVVKISLFFNFGIF